MILSEDYIKVPGKQYKVKVQCVSTRRLTTIEWLIVNCAAKFHDSDQTGNQTIKYVFEEVFQLTNSEILIKPCIESLLAERAIQLDVGSNFEYSTLRFSQVRLTEKGKRMAEDGLFPGATKELPLDIYYNPMTEKMNQFVGGNEKADTPIEFGVPSDYHTDFPEEMIIDALHKGLVGRGKFVASKLRIEGIECLTSLDWDNIIKLTVSVDTEGNLSTQPRIKEDNVKPLIRELFFTKEISPTKSELLIWMTDAQPRNIMGSGKKLKECFLDVCRNGSIIGVSADIYQLYKRNTTAFKQRTVFLWGAKEFAIERSNEALLVELPFSYKISGCVAINEKNESVSFCRNTYSYDGDKITVPVAFEDRRIIPGEHSLIEWLEELINENSNNNLYYLALYSLPIFDKRERKTIELLKRRWGNKDVNAVTEDLQILAKICIELGTDMISMNAYGEELWDKFSYLETSAVLEKMSEIMLLGCISAGSETQRIIMRHILERTEAPKTYNELFVLLQSVGIRSHDDALLYDELVANLYTRDLIIDTLKVILEDKYTKLPELFELDVFFNDYVKAIKELEFLVSGLKMFEENDFAKIAEAIENCPDIALVQSYAAEIIAKNSELLSREVNVYSEMKNIAPKRAESFFNNIEFIKQTVLKMMQSETQKTGLVDGKTDKSSAGMSAMKMFIVDTCALMHHPDLLLSFSDDEYVRIPTKVIDELGKIKDMRSPKYSPDLSRIAARLASDIEHKYLKLFNATSKMRLMIENAELDLLPEELDKRVPDNQILSVALKYKDWDTVIISDDGVFRLTTMAQKMKAITSDEFIEGHKIYRKSMERWVDRFEKSGGTLKTDLVLAAGKTSQTARATFEETNKADALGSLDQMKFDDPGVDKLPIRELKKYLASDLTEPVFSLLQNNGIKTVGQFKELTTKDAQGLKAKGKQTILRNNVIRAIIKFKEMQNEGKTSVGGVIAKTAEENKSDEEADKKLNADIKLSNTGSILENEDAVKISIDAPQVKDFLEAVKTDDLKQAFSLYQSFSADLNMRDQALLFRKILPIADEGAYTNLMFFVFAVYPGWQVRQIIRYLDKDLVEKYKATVDIRRLAQDLVKSSQYEKLGMLVSEWNVEVDYEKWFEGIDKGEILLEMNSVDSVFRYIDECLGEDDSEIMKFLRENMQIPHNVFARVCIQRAKKNISLSKEYLLLLCDYFQTLQADNKTASLSTDNIAEIAIILPESEEDMLKSVIEKCTNGGYKLEKNRRYAQAEPTDKTVEPLRKMIRANKSAQRIVFVYMNSKLRANINVDYMITEMLNAGYPQYEVLDLLKDYWIIGTIKYVQEDDLVRLASGSVSNSRLMVFRSDKIHINGEYGWEEPKEGMTIYFKLQDYIEGGLFYVHYPCTDIAYSN